MSQTIRLNLSYTAYTSADVTLPDGLAWEDVERWWVKWDELHLMRRGATEPEVVLLDISKFDPDLKRPTWAEVTSLSPEGVEVAVLATTDKRAAGHQAGLL